MLPPGRARLATMLAPTGSPTFAMAFAAFDVLAVEGHSVMGEPWTARRKRLEDLLEFDGAMGREDHRCDR